MAGYEGIFANLSLSALLDAVQGAAKNRAAGKGKKKHHNGMMEFVLTDLLMGSLRGNAITGMITCVSQSPRNGDETHLTLTYGRKMALLTNEPKAQRFAAFEKLLKRAKTSHAKSAAIVARGVNGKYMAKRIAEVTQWKQTVLVLEALGADADAAAGGGGASGTSGGGVAPATTAPPLSRAEAALAAEDAASDAAVADALRLGEEAHELRAATKRAATTRRKKTTTRK